MKMQVKLSLFQKLFFLISLTTTCIFFVSYILIRDVIKDDIYAQNTDELTRHIESVSYMYERKSFDQIEFHVRTHQLRATFILLDGTVIYDSEKPSEGMENHGDRQEILKAYDGEKGISQRYSKTLGVHMLYVALLKNRNVVIRLSRKIRNIQQQVKQATRKMLAIHFGLWVLLIIIIHYEARRMTRPLHQITEEIEMFSKEEEPFPRLQSSTLELDLLMDAFNRMQIKVISSMKRMRELENIRKEFIANASHELKTPLTAVMGFIETLEAGAIDEPENNRRFLLIIKNNIKRLTLLVSDMLSLSRIENEGTVTEVVDICNVLGQVALSLHAASNSRIKLSICHAPLYADAREEDIYSAMLNYIDNAMKYGAGSDIEVILKQEGDMAYFEVKDSGSGIDRQHLPRIFERFYRPDKTRSRDRGGTGLGLSIVKNIIEKYDGNVGVWSEVGKGSTFYFYIPLKKT